ncbi:MAG: Hsp33 family molecular chaperone HslO [Clostridia bacterium]|nr:Hsp33 family molecular chaperone HslO [Clostridia bacterium]
MIYQGMLFDNQVAFYAVDSTKMVEAARKDHNFTPVAAAAVGRTISAVTMLAAMLKEEHHRMSATIKGDGPIGSIVAVAKGNLEVKALCSNPMVDLPLNNIGKLDVGGAVGKGTLTVVKDIGLKEPYSGTVELVTGEIGDDFASYMLISEQSPSLCYLGVLVDTDYSIKSSSGIIVRPLPKCNEHIITILEDTAPEIATLHKRLSEGETMENALNDIFLNMGLTFTNKRESTYKCDCSRERMEEVLYFLPKSDIEDMIKEDKGASIVCSFCHTTYDFSEGDLQKLING